MPEPPHPHDRLFRALLGQPGTARALIREWLPAEVMALLSDDPPELEDGTFVDEALQGSQSDRLFRAKLKTGGDLLLYVLFDHKSTSEPGVILQLLGYMCRIWVRRAESKAERFRNLPFIARPLAATKRRYPELTRIEFAETLVSNLVYRKTTASVPG